VKQLSCKYLKDSKKHVRLLNERYIISPSASRDLDEIADYFLRLNLETGEKLFREFNKKWENVANFPNMGRSYAHINPKLRAIPLDGYVIFY
jgi:toxin ParE1/3/4